MGHCDKLGMMINIWNTEIGKKVISPIMDTAQITQFGKLYIWILWGTFFLGKWICNDIY